MKKFETFEGIVLPVDRTNVDTDAIIPKQFLKRIERTGFGEFAFYEFRYDENGEPIKDSVFNQAKYKGASILISRANFGCGSSREHAPWALEDYGIKVIIAPSYADIFYNNCFNNGILPIKLDNEIMDKIFNNTYTEDSYKLKINLSKNEITDENDLNIKFKINEFYKFKLLNGLDDIALTLLKEESIKEYETKNNII